jgi:hypothetical protein
LGTAPGAACRLVDPALAKATTVEGAQLHGHPYYIAAAEGSACAAASANEQFGIALRKWLTTSATTVPLQRSSHS